ncbi:PDZ domain-containing protein [Cytobacillus sp. Hz8]|uniref:PDZ domain-containing protein n=1 Tax=Cytobacillus sp. Hz8 TaxID=3347168 RepID=UPI0035DD4AC4
MVQEWLLELLKGLGMLFLHPIFYYLFLLAAFFGVSRVKRERRNFHIRVENAYFELRQLLPLGIVIGLVASIMIMAVGLVVPVAFILLTAAFTLLWGATTKIRWLSPIYTVGFAFFALIFLAGKDLSLPFFNGAFKDLDRGIFPSIALLLTLLLIGEGILIVKNGVKGTSPKIVKSKRGLSVGVHEVKRLWMVPIFLLIPGDAISLPFGWWPVFSIGGESYSLFLVPFAVGYYQLIQGMLPRDAIRFVGKRVILFGGVLALLSIASIWIPLVAIAIVALAIIGREFISYRQRLFEENLPFYFSKKNYGLMILGIIPDSPAYKMGLEVGELISKVNGTIIHDEKNFYESLQKNRAHCKLEILDVNGEVRFVQRALYEGDHHELGILFVQDDNKWGNEAV